MLKLLRKLFRRNHKVGFQELIHDIMPDHVMVTGLQDCANELRESFSEILIDEAAILWCKEDPLIRRTMQFRDLPQREQRPYIYMASERPW